MSIQIQPQADKVWKLLSGRETFDIYKKAVTTTWDIIRETAILIWLMLCLVLVVFDWIWSFVTNTVQGIKNFQGDSETNVMSNIGQTLADVTKSSTSSAIAQAREQLGLPEKESKPTPVPQAKKAESAPAVPKPESAPPAAPTPESVPAAPAKTEAIKSDIADSE